MDQDDQRAISDWRSRCRCQASRNNNSHCLPSSSKFDNTLSSLSGSSFYSKSLQPAVLTPSITITTTSQITSIPSLLTNHEVNTRSRRSTTLINDIDGHASSFGRKTMSSLNRNTVIMFYNAFLLLLLCNPIVVFSSTTNSNEDHVTSININHDIDNQQIDLTSSPSSSSTQHANQDDINSQEEYQVFTDQFVLEISGGPEAAQAFADNHDFVYLGPVFGDHYHLRHKRISKRSLSRHDHQGIIREAESHNFSVSNFSGHTINRIIRSSSFNEGEKAPFDYERIEKLSNVLCCDATFPFILIKSCRERKG